MKSVTTLLFLGLLLILAAPTQGQSPTTADDYYNRGILRGKIGDLEAAVTEYRKYIELEPRNADGYGKLAWVLATVSKDSIRDGTKAVEYARKAAELTKWENAGALDTLAAAYAEAGNFDEAVKWENKALSFAEFVKNLGDEARKRLELYTARQPYHERAAK